MPNILVTNDDGVSAPGIQALAQVLDDMGTVTVLAPERNWSAAGHPKTMHKPLRIQTVRWPDGRTAYASSGAPSDCVALALMGAVETEFDLVVSGINSNYNLGTDVLYSGTVAGAMEAIISGVPALAVSLGRLDDPALERRAALDKAAAVAGHLADLVLARGLPPYTLLNVNVPGIPPACIQGSQVTRLGRRIYRDVLVVRDDPWGRPYYWIGGEVPTGVPEDGSDIGAIENDFISVTPLGIDLTNHSCIETLRDWDL